MTKAIESIVTFLKQLIIEHRKIRGSKSSADYFKKYFANTGPQLASKILSTDLGFELFLPISNTTLTGTMLTENVFEEVFKSLKRNKASSYDIFHVNVIKSVHEYVS